MKTREEALNPWALGVRRHGSFDEEYASHMKIWGPHCGAPKSVYAGHLQVLLNSAKAQGAVEAYQKCEQIAHDFDAAGEDDYWILERIVELIQAAARPVDKVQP